MRHPMLHSSLGRYSIMIMLYRIASRICCSRMPRARPPAKAAAPSSRLSRMYRREISFFFIPISR